MFENYTFTPIGSDQYLYRDVQNTNFPLYIIQNSTAQMIMNLFLPGDADIIAILAENELRYTLKTGLLSGASVENNLLQMELSSAQNVSSALKSKVLDLEGAHAADQSKIQGLEKANAASKDKLNEKENRQSELYSSLKDALERLEILQRQMEINVLERDDLRKKNKKYATVNAAFFSEVEQLKKKNSEFFSEVEGLKKIISEKEKALEQQISTMASSLSLPTPLPPTLPPPLGWCYPQDPRFLPPLHPSSFPGGAPQNVLQLPSPQNQLPMYSAHVGGGSWRKITGEEGASNLTEGHGARGAAPYVVRKKRQ